MSKTFISIFAKSCAIILFPALALFLALFLPSSLHSQIPSYVPTNGLVGYWPFNGNANDESGNGNHGTVNGATLTSDRNGNSSSAYYFNGTSNSITVNNAFFDNGWLNNTICFWFKPNSNSINSCIINTIPHDGTAVSFGLYGTNQKLYFGKNSDPDQHLWNIIGGNLGNHEFSYPAFDFEQWYFISIVKFGNNYEFYVNSILDHITTSSITPISYACSIIFGNLSPNQGYASEFYKGSLDDLVIYSTALTQEEITALYNGTTNTPISGCTNSTACNYNASATQDDGSCTFPPQTYLNCAGTCINDVDNDGTCDELETPALPSYLPSNGLVGYWPFNGNANDESGNGNHGTVNGATLTNDRNGNANSAYSFENNNSVITATNNFPFGNESRTICVNVFSSNFSQLNKMIAGYGNDNPLQMFSVIMYNSCCLGQPAFWARDHDIPYQNALANNNWHQLCITYNNNEIRTYYNAELNQIVDYSNTPLNTPNSLNFHIGNFNENVQGFFGLIDDIAIYNRALTQEEITALYNGTTNNGGGNGGTTATPAQSVPQGIPYQAMIRDNNGAALINTPVTVRFSLRQDAIDGTVEYQETHNLTTNAFGLINTHFGTGTATQGTFANINWSNTTKFIQVEANTGGGFVEMGTQQMMSVPFALKANESNKVKNAGLPVYANNAAALAGGLVAGDMYRTAAGALYIVY